MASWCTNAWSPRLAVSRYIPRCGLYYCTPPTIAFSRRPPSRIYCWPALRSSSARSIPWRIAFASPSGARNYYEVGVPTKSILGKLRMDANIFRRDFQLSRTTTPCLRHRHQFSHCIFQCAHLWRRSCVSKFLSGGDSPATSAMPISPASAAAPLPAASSSAATPRAVSATPVGSRSRRTSATLCASACAFQAERRLWFALSAQYGSGLPVEFDDTPDFSSLLAQYGPAILNRVDFDRGRVRSGIFARTLPPAQSSTAKSCAQSRRAVPDFQPHRQGQRAQLRQPLLGNCRGPTQKFWWRS